MKFPVIISGGFLQGERIGSTDPLFVRAMVLDDGAIRLAIVIVDTLMMPRELIDDAKQRLSRPQASRPTGSGGGDAYPHGPVGDGRVGNGVDRAYADRLPGWIAEVSRPRQATSCPPESAGPRPWTASTPTAGVDHRPDRIGIDPFGERTIRAMMHPGYQNPDYIGPAGPEDPGLTCWPSSRPTGGRSPCWPTTRCTTSGRARVGRLLRPVLPRMQQLVSKAGADRPCVAMMSQGTAGDLHWMDYSQPRDGHRHRHLQHEVAEVAFGAWQQIEYRDGCHWRWPSGS